MQELAPELQFVERVANPAAFADVDEGRALKVLVYAMPDLPQPNAQAQPGAGQPSRSVISAHSSGSTGVMDSHCPLQHPHLR